MDDFELELVDRLHRDLWDSINAKRAPWSSNPWVWVIEFRMGLKLPQEAT